VSGAAFAQSNVTIYGNLDIGYVQGTYDNNTRTAGGVVTKTSADIRSTGVQDGPLSTNHIGFRGSEDLGNGLKASFQLEYGLAESEYFGADTGGDTGNGLSTAGRPNSNMAMRKQNIGLSGGFGSVTIGRQGVLIDEAWGVGSAGMKNNAYGDMYSSAVGGSGNILNTLPYFGGNTQTTGGFHDTRANELITYVSPNFSGFTAAVQYGKGETDVSVTGGTGSNAEHTNWGLRADYANGPLALVAAYNSEKNDNTTVAAVGTVSACAWAVGATGAVTTNGCTKTDKNSWLLGANYNFGIVKVFGQYFDGSRSADTYNGTLLQNAKSNSDMNGWELGVHVPVTAQITLAATYFDTSTNWKTATAAAVPVVAKGDVDGKGYQFAALYGFSKRTTAYAMYGWEQADQDTNASLARSNNEIWNVAAGLKHTF
jgi:predicted porin